MLVCATVHATLVTQVLGSFAGARVHPDTSTLVPFVHIKVYKQLEKAAAASILVCGTMDAAEIVPAGGPTRAACAT